MKNARRSTKSSLPPKSATFTNLIANALVIERNLRDQNQAGKHFTIVVVAEGARPAGEGFVTSADQPDNREARLGGIGAQVAAEIHNRTWKETRSIVPGFAGCDARLERFFASDVCVREISDLAHFQHKGGNREYVQHAN